ncbi:MAG TPA: glutathione S-transferase family protein [Candidatus Binataceae bacterium]|nr:glutathione S-transferase family protein [Candidatus Binataceae bacterium]
MTTKTPPEPPRLKLYQFAASGNSRIVRLVLEEKGLKFERVNIDVTKGENRTPEFLKLNPRGKVPVLVHGTPEGDVVLSESSVINEYLEEVFPDPPLMPATPAQRAHVRSLVYLFDTELSPTTGLLIIEKLLKKPEEQRAEFVAERLKATREILTRVSELMDSHPFMVGDFSLADASYVPVLSVMAPCGIILDREFPKLASWMAEVKKRPSFTASAH